MITVVVLALTMPPSPMFARRFEREQDAVDYEAMWRQLGHCHLRRTK